jgi:hypothetical protein
MTPQMIATTVQLVIAPVVMISACSIFVNGLLTRYGPINDRMRLMARERMELELGPAQNAPAPKTPFVLERLSQIDYQLPRLVHRHRLIRNAVLAVYLSTLLFVVDMFVIAASVLTNAEWITTLILVTLLLGIVALFVAVVFAIIEVRRSHLEVAYEVLRVIRLGSVEPVSENTRSTKT